jgi:hypothetical protein
MEASMDGLALFTERLRSRIKPASNLKKQSKKIKPTIPDGASPPDGPST